MLASLCLLVGTALAGGGGHGGGDWKVPGYKADVPPSVTLTVAPLRLIDRPVLEGTAEFRVAEKRSFALMASRALGPMTGALQGSRPPMELGLQVREYLAGDFGNGLALGARASVTNPRPLQMRVDRTELSPFLALKVTLALFTVEVRGGPEIAFGPKGIEVAPAVDLGAGLSF